MAGRWRVAVAAGGAFVAVAAVSVGLVALHGGSGAVTPGSRPASPSKAAGFGGPYVIRLTSPPKIVYVHPTVTKVLPTR